MPMVGYLGLGASSPLGWWQDDLARHHQARRPLAADVAAPERACRLAPRPVKDLQISRRVNPIIPPEGRRTFLLMSGQHYYFGLIRVRKH